VTPTAGPKDEPGSVMVTTPSPGLMEAVMLTSAGGNVLSPLLVSAQPTNAALVTEYVSVR
jgi:hypothetical protein